MVTMENYEEYMVLMADGELDAAGQQELEAFLQLHPELREELIMYETAHLVPDTTMVYGNKESLLKQEPKAIALGGQWFRYGAAAGLAALIALGIMKWQGNDEGTEVVSVDTVEHISTPIAKTQDTAVPTPQQQEVIVKQEAEEPKHEEQKQEQRIAPVAPKIATVKEEKRIRIQQPLPEKMELAAIGEMHTEKNTRPQYNTVAVPALPAVEKTAPETGRDALAWLPIDEDRKEGLNNIGEVLSARLDKVKEVRDNIKNTDLAVKLGNKELFTIRF